MEIVKIIGIGFIAIIVSLILKQYKPEFSLYITLLASTIILLVVVDKIAAIIELLNTLSNKIQMNNTFLKVILKITGITIITEFAVNVCRDCGENAIASKVELGGKIIIVTMSIPILTALLEVIMKILPT